MKNYTTFEEVVSRIKYGTTINVMEAYTNKLIFNKIWRHSDNVEDFERDILDAEVVGFSVGEERELLVNIFKQ